MNEYVNKLLHIEACHKCLRENGVLYEASYADERLFDAIRSLNSAVNGSENNRTAEVIEKVDVKEFVTELGGMLDLTHQMIVDEIRNHTHFDGATFRFEIIAKTLAKYTDIVIGQCISIDGYLALLFAMRKMGKKLLTKGSVNDAMRMAEVNEDLNDIEDIIAALKKAKIKHNVNDLPFEIPKATFDNFEMLSDRAYCCYEWLRNQKNRDEPWWAVMKNV